MPKIDNKNIIIDTAIHFRLLVKRLIFSNIMLVCATFTAILWEDKTEKIANAVVEKPINIEETTNKLNCKLSDSNCFKKIIYPLSIPVYHSKYPNSIPLFTAASIDINQNEPLRFHPQGHSFSHRMHSISPVMISFPQKVLYFFAVSA